MVGLRANLDAKDTEAISAQIGLIYQVTKFLYVMGGLNDGSLALGFGLQLGFFELAYAINRDPLVTDFQHHVDVNFSF
jgi:hypothetical protein